MTSTNTLFYLRTVDEALRSPYGEPIRATAVVGWDVARATFFAQVQVVHENPAAYDDIEQKVRVGSTARELTSAREALDAVAGYAEVPPGLEAMLEAAAGPAEHRRPGVLTANEAERLDAAGGMTTFFDGTDELTASAAPINLDRADRRRAGVAQAFGPLHHVEASVVATAAPAEPPAAVRPHQGRRP